MQLGKDGCKKIYEILKGLHLHSYLCVTYIPSRCSHTYDLPRAADKGKEYSFDLLSSRGMLMA
jgi:hypothetical protein